MPVNAGFPGATNVYIPGTNSDVDGRLIIGYSRNAKKFTFPRYAQYVKAPTPVGYYLKLSNQEQTRVVNTWDFIWPDGNNRPSRNRDLEAFNFLTFRTERYDYGFTIGEKTVKYASWAIVEQHSDIKSTQLMTNRSFRGLSVLTTPANWGVSADPDMSQNHTSATGTALGTGGSVYAGTSTNPRLKMALNTIAVAITLDTAGVVGYNPDEMCVLVNPNTARKLSESAEIHDYLKGTPDALDEVKLAQGPNAMYGLPARVYGYNLVVEIASRVTSRVGATLTRSFVLPDNALIVTSRPNGLDGVYGAPSFSTLSMFYLEEMTLERFDDPRNRLCEGHVVEDAVEILTAPASGWYVADISS